MTAPGRNNTAAGHEQAATALLDAGAAPFVCNAQGLSMFELARAAEHSATENLLLDHGADPTHPGRNGQTAMEAFRSPAQFPHDRAVVQTIESWQRERRSR